MTDQLKDVKLPEGMNNETLAHLMEPQNYGKLDDANGVGVALDEKTKEYVIFYTLLKDGIIKNAKYATNGCQMFTDMIKDNNLDYAKGAIKRMNEKLGTMSAQQQVCADIVFSSFLASLTNYENVQKGADEELHLFKMKESCDAINS